MSATGTTEFTQAEAGGKGEVRFVLTRDAITCEVSDGVDDVTMHHGWEDLAPPSFHKRVGRPDKWLDRAWTYSAIVMVGVPFILRDSDPVRVYLVVLVVAVLLVGFLTLLRKPQGSQLNTEIPVDSETLPVFHDAQHDTILAAIEGHRRNYLIGLEPSETSSLREHLAYLDMLLHHEVIDAATYAARRDRFRVDAAPQPPAEGPPLTFRQRRIGFEFEHTLSADRVAVRDRGPFRHDTTMVLPIDRPLGAQGRLSIFDERLAFVISGWLGAPFVALLLGAWWYYGPMMSGGEGWKNIFVYMGPPALGIVAALAIANRLATARLILLDPGITMLDDASAGPIIAAIKQSRRSALRRLARPDPARPLALQSATLDRLLSEGVIDAAEHAAFLQAATTLSADPRLDQPLAPASS